MSKSDKGNFTKIYAVWSQRIEKELGVNVSTDRVFRVGHKPSIMAEKVNHWNPQEQQHVSTTFAHPPVAEISDPKYVGIELFPRERFDIPQSEYHKIGWMLTPKEYRTQFATKVMEQKKEKEIGFSTGLWNKRDEWFMNERRAKRHPRGHHCGYITGLGDNPYEKTIKNPEKLDPSSKQVQELEKIKKRGRREQRRRLKLLGISKSTPNLAGASSRGVTASAVAAPSAVTASAVPATYGELPRVQVEKDDQSAVGSDLWMPPEREPSVVDSMASLYQAHKTREQIFQLKVQNSHKALDERYARWKSIGAKKRWNHGLSNSDVTLFADSYTKQMLTGPFMKTQILVSR